MPTDKMISILGLKGAGKSTYLAVLNIALALENSDWRIRATGNTIKIMSVLRNFLSTGEYPPQTNEEVEMEFIVEKDATALGFKPGAQFKLHAADVPGEAVKGVSSNNSLYINFYERHLKGCSGIIFLLDYAEIWLKGKSTPDNADDYLPLFSSILDQIRDQSDNNPYIAFCVTKVDMADGHGPGSKFDQEGYSNSAEDLAERILGRNAKAVIDHEIDSEHLLWLSVSATGFTGKGANREPQFMEKTDADGKKISGIRNPKDLRPIGVAEPLEWILNNLANQDENGRIIRTRGQTYADIVKGFRKVFGL